MAFARCDDHRPDDADHAAYALPIGYPSSDATCDVVGCEQPARVWLTRDERAAFLGGRRVFTVGTGAEFRVSDGLFPN